MTCQPRLRRTLLTIARTVERLRQTTDQWWRQEIAAMGTYDLAQTRRLVLDARDRFSTTLTTQAVISARAISPVQEQLAALCAAASVDPAVVLRGALHEEGAMLDDLWDVSRETLDFDEFLHSHGYQGPGEGEVETRVWREDPAPLRRQLEQYAAKPDTEAPHSNAGLKAQAREDAERQLLTAAGGPLGRQRAKLILRLARRFIPLRGTGKVSYLQSLDVLRAAAHRLGALLFQQDAIDDPGDTFYLTAEELAAPMITDVRVLIGDRRAIRARYQSLTLPAAWTGQPVPECSPDDDERPRTLRGVGACTGVVQGRALVVLDPSDAEIEPGDILVAHTTDPAWVSLMFLAGALVVDIGGMMSHAAVVARELGIPCVMNTGRGTTALRTGDLISVDGGTGTVEILERTGDARMTNALTTAWGPLAEPVHADAADGTEPTWKDNAYLSFWDVEGGVYGSFHVSTSPNDPESRRARCSVQLGGEVIEIIEGLPGGSFTGPTISFGLDGTLTVDHPDLVVRLTNTPLWTPADYSLNELIPPLVPDRPLQHFQQGCRLTGIITHGGRSWPVSGHGMRDRTWGFRDEAAQWVEYAGIVGIIDDGFVTAMKFLGPDGDLKSDGYWVDDDGPASITDIGFRRTAAAQFLSATLGLADGRTRAVSVTSRRAGFFVPMGRETDGPAFGTYDDFMTLRSETGVGAGFFEQGIVHRVF